MALLISVVMNATEEQIVLRTTSGNITGRLTLPDDGEPCPIAIAGSGPTDMNGNTVGSGYKNNSLKMLAEELAIKGIASVRYDKRGVGMSADAATDEREIRFEHYIEDAIAWADMLKGDKRFNRVIVIGHSEGSLIGMVATNRSKAIDAFISIAGAGRPAYEIIEEQLMRQSEQMYREAAEINNKLREGILVEEVPSELASLYRKSVQPYLISWFRYNPTEEIKKIRVPVLILQGDKDIQVPVGDAEKLYAARLFSSYRIIENMNHVLKHCESLNTLIQMQTYQDPSLPIEQTLTESIASFVKR